MHLAWGLFVYVRQLGLLLVLFASRQDRDLLVQSTVSSFSIHFMWDRMQQEQPLLLRLLARIPADLLIWGFQRRRSSGVERVGRRFGRCVAKNSPRGNNGPLPSSVRSFCQAQIKERTDDGHRWITAATRSRIKIGMRSDRPTVNLEGRRARAARAAMATDTCWPQIERKMRRAGGETQSNWK